MDFPDEFKKYATPTEDDFYLVTGRGGKKKKEPSARILQSWANRSRISTEIRKVDINKDYAQAIVHGWVGPKAEPIMETEEVVTIYFEHYEQEWMVRELDKKTEFDYSVGKIIFKDQKSAEILFKYINRKKMYGDREAVTKAQSRIYRKLLGAEWREDAEQEAEAEEVATVQETIKDQRSQTMNQDKISEKQESYLIRLINQTEKGDVVDLFLKNHGVKQIIELGKGDASELIEILKGGEQ